MQPPKPVVPQTMDDVLRKMLATAPATHVVGMKKRDLPAKTAEKKSLKGIFSFS